MTLFGAEVERTGRPELESTFDWVASRFEGCRSFEYDVVAAGATNGESCTDTVIPRGSSQTAQPLSFRHLRR